jgi:cyclopropane-fatty-acyl-phospholipid synthase
MSDIPTIVPDTAIDRTNVSGGGFALRRFERLTRTLEAGSLTIVLPNGRKLVRTAPKPGPQATLMIRRWRTFWRLAVGGELGFEQAYIDGDWWTPDLLAVIDFGAKNEVVLRNLTNSTLLMRLVARAHHWLHRNTRGGSRRNIHAHYDLGNEFYRQWLDRGMSYSSAIYTNPDMSLEQAQDAKLDRIVELLGIAGGEKILEIGIGWGALAERLAARCEVTGITLSTEQLAIARERLAANEKLERANLRLQDYRDVDGRFDRIVSVEMIEAVGESYWPAYFGKLRQSLKRGGDAVLQAITIAEDRFAAYRSQPDFIQRYIFPGGMLPTINAMRREAAKAGLTLVSQETFGLSYAKTLAEWRERFVHAWPTIETLGFDARFKRMWEYYLCYCEVGFRAKAIDVGLYKFSAD